MQVKSHHNFEVNEQLRKLSFKAIKISTIPNKTRRHAWREQHAPSVYVNQCLFFNLRQFATSLDWIWSWPSPAFSGAMLSWKFTSLYCVPKMWILFFIKFCTSINFHKCVETVNGVSFYTWKILFFCWNIPFKTFFLGYKYKFFVRYEISSVFAKKKRKNWGMKIEIFCHLRIKADGERKE